MEEEERIYYGIWTVPGSELKAQGKLLATPHNLQLEVIDADVHQLVEINEETKVPVIFGTGQYRESITLFNCSTFSGSDFEPEFMIYGDKHYNSLQEVNFQLVQSIIPTFNEWFNNRSFKTVENDTGFELQYKKRDPINLDISDKVALTIDFECRKPQLNFDFFPSPKIILQEHSNLRLSSKVGDVPLSEYFSILNCLQDFISFVSRDGCNVNSITGFESKESSRRKPQHGYPVFSLNKFNKYYNKGGKLDPLFTFDEISGDFSSIVSNWFDFYKNSSNIVSLVLHDYFYRGRFDENRFLNLIRALETFHRYYYKNEVLPKDLFKEKIESIVERIQPEFQKEILEKLHWANEPTLQMRLMDLLKEIDEFDFEIGTYLQNDFIKKAKQTRNYFTHYDQSLKKKALAGEDLIRLTEDCRTLLNVVILNKIGIPKQVIKKTFKYYLERSYYFAD